MNSTQGHNLIIKFLNKEANRRELEELDDWLSDQNNITIFNNLVRIHYLTTSCMADYDLHKAKESIKQKVKSNKRKSRLHTYTKISIAASILLVIGLIFGGRYFQKDTESISNKIVIGSDKAVLTLENGDQVALEKGKSFQKGTIRSNGEQIVYGIHGRTDDEGDVLYNYLTIPRGGQFYLQLSDGTKVWLNAETKLKYPVTFYEGQTREVELVYGEAYFEVTPSTQNKGSDFSVISNDQKISVLGTEFNVSAYKDDDAIVTTLVGGRIALEKGNSRKTLRPNQQSRILKNMDQIEVVDIDASQAISWVNGVFIFDGESLDEIMKVLSRWYDIDVIFESAQRKDFNFTGILERTKSFDDILALIGVASQGEVKFEVKNKTVHIK
ncbi:FecR family protein [Flagellimonas sp.]|uniref:FecR family protein n=1 Tax=Flagellimonas sp. TaxID=2058762 RepID=UPI003BAD6427